MTALCDHAFREALRSCIDRGNDHERQLAQIALDLYELVPEHPLVVHYVNQYSLRVLT